MTCVPLFLLEKGESVYNVRQVAINGLGELVGCSRSSCSGLVATVLVLAIPYREVSWKSCCLFHGFAGILTTGD